MADQQKQLSPANQKKKSSHIDEEIGKEFLISWKSMSMKDDDPMDFNFDVSSKGKKKAFSFDEKLDLDFNLDSDFNKLSSFKVDMSDLDFSSSPKKSAKSKEKSEGETSSKPKKQDHFDFNFDFNVLDSFNLGSSLTRSDNNVSSNVEKNSFISEGRDSEVAEKPGTDITGNITLGDDMVTESSALEKVSTSQVETFLGETKELSPENDNSISKCSPYTDLTMSHKCSISPEIENAIYTEEGAEKGLSEKMKLRDPISQEVARHPPQTLHSQNGRRHDTDARECSQVSSLSTDTDNSLVSNQNLHNNMTALVDFDCEKSAPENPSLTNVTKPESNYGDSIKLNSSIAPEARSDAVLDQVSDKDVVDVEDNASTNPLEIPNETGSSKVDQNSTSESPSAPTSCRPADVGSHMQNAPSSGLKDESAGKQIGSHLSSATKIQNEGKIGRNQVGDSMSADEKSLATKSGLLSSVKSRSTGCPKNSRLVSSCGLSNIGKLVPNVRSDEINASQGTQENSKDGNKLSYQGKAPSSKELKSSSIVQPFLHPLLVSSSAESLENIRTSSGEVSTLLPVKAGKITRDLSRLQTSRSKGANNILPSPLRQTEIKHLGKSKQYVDAVGGKAPNNNHLMDSSPKQMLQPFNSLQKRKTYEVLDADLGSLKPPKRISPSASGSRLPPSACQNVKDCPDKKVSQQAHIDEVQIEKKYESKFLDCQTGGIRSPLNLSMLKLESTVLVDDNGNVRKAEAYAKELEDICYILKKKQDEAKELLIRAIVTNNNLLMLNHPIYEDKIRKVQKFASQLESKEIRTWEGADRK